MLEEHDSGKKYISVYYFFVLSQFKKVYFDLSSCPFELLANKYSQSSPNSQIGWAGWQLAQKDIAGSQFIFFTWFYQ